MRTIIFLTLVFLACLGCKKHIEAPAPVVDDNPYIYRTGGFICVNGNTYTIEAYADGISGKDKGYVITDNFFVGDIGAPTPADSMEVTFCDSSEFWKYLKSLSRSLIPANPPGRVIKPNLDKNIRWVYPLDTNHDSLSFEIKN